MKQQSKTIQKKAFIGILCSVILIFLDQFTKYLAVQHLKDQMPVVLWKNVLELSYLENRGAAFGIFQGKQWHRQRPLGGQNVPFARPGGAGCAHPGHQGGAFGLDR